MGITTAIILLGGRVSYDEFNIMWHEDGYTVFPSGYFRPLGHCLLGPSETPRQDGYVTVEATQWVLEHLTNLAAPQQELDLRWHHALRLVRLVLQQRRSASGVA